MNNRLKTCVLAALGGWCVVGTVLAQPANTVVINKSLPGYDLFERNCAHCHAADATGGEEAPDLHGLYHSDSRISKIIKNGIHGEMPAFGKKLNDDDVKALIAWLRTLKE